jgi:flagellar biogenesis protein FliO
MQPEYKVLYVLIILVPCIILLGFILKKLLVKRSKTLDEFKILQQQFLNNKERLILIEVDNKKILLGCTGQMISTLHVFNSD